MYNSVNNYVCLIEHIELDVSEEWLDVVVVNVVSSKDFCVQRLTSEHSKALEKLSEVMGKYYHDNGTTGECDIIMYSIYCHVRVSFVIIKYSMITCM